MKLEQHNTKVNDEEKRRRILKRCPDGMSVVRRTLSMFTGVKFNGLGEALVIVEEGQEEHNAGGTHGLATSIRLQGGGQRGAEAGLTVKKEAPSVAASAKPLL